MSEVYSDEAFSRNSYNELFSQKPHLRSLAGFWFLCAGRRGFLMFSEGKKKTKVQKFFS